MAYAHSRNAGGVRHDLVAHLRAVGVLTRQFAQAFHSGEAGYWLGLWHDVGKFDPKWQEYLLAAEQGRRIPTVDHKAGGTLLVEPEQLGWLALLIHGHHGGLRDPQAMRTWLDEKRDSPGVAEAIRLARLAIPDLAPTTKIALPDFAGLDRLSHEFFLRMLFSALIDADRLDTEHHTNPDNAAVRGSAVSVAELWERLDRDQQQFANAGSSPVGAVRAEVYRACIAAAELPPGLFRLSVPTGGGKTRSAMAFALRHAMYHELRRVIVAVPFISITQQTAQVYRDIFGVEAADEPVVLEHHSGGVRERGGDDEFDPASVWARLSAENWDAPVVVTTTVQLFESLFQSATSATRKLHRLARSVIILDEAQALPPHLLKPILDALRQLCTNYGATVVLSTATQPAFEAIPGFAELGAREIVPEPARLFASLRRVRYEWRTASPAAWAEVAGWMRREPQALAVVNTKRDALDLLTALDDPEVLHLSTLLCGAHRFRTIQEVKRRLQQSEPCRLVSTQVVEAGVDIDFPIVLRALAPLDSIIQAAGRCNREGEREFGTTIVFEPEASRMPPGAYAIGANATRVMLASRPLDPDDPAVAQRYYKRFLDTLGDLGTDKRQIQQLRERFNFPAVAEAFQMIDDTTMSVIVSNYGADGERERVRRLVDELRAGGHPTRRIMRQLQPYMVAVRWNEATHYEREGLISPRLPGVGHWEGDYSERVGLTGRDLDPEALVG